MNKIIILFFLIFQNPDIYSQNFTVVELEKVMTLDVDEFETFVMKKGYEFVNFEKTEYSDNLSYGFDEKNRNKYEHYISRFKYNQKEGLMISFQTYKTEYYLNLKKELKISGYKFRGTEYSDDGTKYFLNYEKNGISFSLTTLQMDNDSGDKITNYEISLFNTN